MHPFYLLLTALLGFAPVAVARPSDPADSLRQRLTTQPADTNRVLQLSKLAGEYVQTAPLATIQYSKQALQLAQRLQFQEGEGHALVWLGAGFRETGNYPAALEMGLQALRIGENLADSRLTGRALNALGYLNYEQGNSRQALAYLFRAKALADKTNSLLLLTRVTGNIGAAYLQLNRLDSALYYFRRGYALDVSQKDLSSEVGDEAMLGNVYAGMGNLAQARLHYRRSAYRASPQHITYALCWSYLGQAQLFQRLGSVRMDSAAYFGRRALAAGQQGHYPKGILDASQFLAEVEAARHDTVAAFRYITLANATRDSLFSRTKMAQVQVLAVSEQLRRQEAADQRAQAIAERRQLWLLAALASTVPALLLLGRNNRLKQRANRLLNLQNAQIASQRDTLRTTLDQLEATQVQLVQAEKMAFLGELTAGIAHELQNPLSFVKNFAEVSSELIDDMADSETRSKKPHTNQTLLLADLKQNLREISQHGQRATSIISGILARSRNGGAPLVPTDLNALVAEAVALAYDEQRVKAPAFAATLTTHLAHDLGLVPAIAPDLSRVILNLCTNAFYAVRLRQQQADSGYQPEVRVGTRRLPNGHVEIRVRDNGTGMSEAVREQIFRPFFTTKPGGEGTGLGLSLSHDIVAQSHGGTLSVYSEEGKFTEFTVCIPG